MDTATHPDFQRQGIFSRLTLTLLERLESEEQLDLVFNTPNADSRPGYLRMGWEPVASLPVRISPVRPLRFVAGLGAARKATAAGSATAVAPVATRRVSCPLPSAGEVLADEESVTQLLARRGRSPRLQTPLSVALPPVALRRPSWSRLPRGDRPSR